MDNTDAKPKKRAVPFNDGEKLALTEAIKEHHSILFGNLKPELTFKDKTEAWKEVQEAVRKVSGQLRTITQLKEKYKNMKRETKSIAAHNKKEIFKTGGGAADVVELDPASQAILDTIPMASIQGIASGIDTSIPTCECIINAVTR